MNKNGNRKNFSLWVVTRIWLKCLSTKDKNKSLFTSSKEVVLTRWSTLSYLARLSRRCNSDVGNEKAME